LNRTSKKIFSYLIKAAILLLAFVFISRRLNNNADLEQFEKLVGGINHSRAWCIMALVFLLMLLNWLLEAVKWRFLAQRLARLSLWQSTEAVFCGLTWAIFTPNRIGEYGGRVMFLPQRRRIHGVFAMAVGSFGQNVITNVLGAIALMWFIWHFMAINLWLYIGLLIIAMVFSLLMILFYFNIRWMVSLFDSVKFLRKFHRFFDIMGRYKFTDLLRIMGFCIARFAVFSFQYYLVIHLLIPQIPLYDVLMMILILFFIQSALPSLDLLDIGVRNLTGGTLFAYVTDQRIAVMAAITSIWLINLIIPAILGSVFVFKLKFFDNNL
jgi:uncharacterized membrane protein YbhN (UPF0104 family)